MGDLRGFIGKAAVAFVTCAVVLAAARASAENNPDRPTVVFFYGGVAPTDAWTRLLTAIGESAAEDLGLNFELVYSGPGRKEIYDMVSQRIEAEDKPEYALVVNYRNGAEYILEYLDSQGVKSFLFNADLSDEGKALVGEPREKLPNWIGRLIPDDERAGYDLANYLFEQARRDNPGEMVKAIGITGSYASTAAVKRMEGLRRAAEEAEDVDLKQVVTARWSPPVAGQKYNYLKNRYGKFDVVWVANDGMAMGVLEAIDPVTEHVKLGGMDWTTEALDALKEGSMTASMGGHILDIGYVLAIIKRYDEGCDFASSPGDATLSSLLSLMTADTEEYQELIETRDWGRLDFSIITCDVVQADDFDNLSIDMFYKLKEETAG